MMRLPAWAPMDSAPGEPGDVTRYDVVQAARSLIGVRYEHQHRDRVVGVDCIGEIIWVARHLGIVAPDFDVNGYGPKPDGKTLLAECSRFMTPVADRDARPGHVLVLAYRRDPQHMGILGDYMEGGLSLIHSYADSNGKGQVREQNMAYELRGFRPIKAFALPGVR